MANPVTPGPNTPKLVITAPAEGSTVDGRDRQRHVHDDGRSHRRRPRPFPGRQRPGQDGPLARRHVCLFGRPRGLPYVERVVGSGDHSKIGGTDATPVHFSNVVDPADPTSPTVAVTCAGERRHRLGSRRPSRRTRPTTSASTACSSSSTERRSVSRTSPPRTRRQLGHDARRQRLARADGDRARRGGQRDDRHACDGHRRQQRLRSRAGREWASPTTLPIIPIHTSMLPNGKLLIFDSATEQRDEPAGLGSRRTNTFTQVPYNDSAEPVLRGPHAARRRAHPRRRGSRRTRTSASRTPRSSIPATNTWTRRQADGERPLVSDTDEASRRPHARRLRLQRLSRLLDTRCARTTASSPHRRSSILRPTLVDRYGRQPPPAALSAHVRPARRADLRRERPRRRRSRAGSSTSRPGRGASSTAPSATAAALSCTCRGRS